MKHSILIAKDGSHVGVVRQAEPPVDAMPFVLTWKGRAFVRSNPGATAACAPQYSEVDSVALGLDDVDEGPVK